MGGFHCNLCFDTVKVDEQFATFLYFVANNSLLCY